MLERATTKFGIENIQTESKVVLYLGFLVEQRLPYKEVLGAFLRIISESRLKNAYLLIVGRQNEARYGERIMAENIISLARKRGLDRNLGLVLLELSDEEKLKIIAESEVMFYPFTTSRLNPPVVDPPLAILESMSSGKKVLSSAVLSAPEIINNGVNGFLLSQLDEESISRALSRAIDCQSDIGTNARDTILKKFSLASVSRVLDNINEQIVQMK